jgi:hypothetical protein
VRLARCDDGLLGVLTGCHACEPLDAFLKFRRQRFLAQGRIHGPKPLAQAVPIRATEPWFVISERAGQQLHRTPCGVDSRRSHDDPLSVVLSLVQRRVAVSFGPNDSEREALSYYAKTGRNCEKLRAEVWAEWGSGSQAGDDPAVSRRCISGTG